MLLVFFCFAVSSSTEICGSFVRIFLPNNISAGDCSVVECGVARYCNRNVYSCSFGSLPSATAVWITLRTDFKVFYEPVRLWVFRCDWGKANPKTLYILAQVMARVWWSIISGQTLRDAVCCKDSIKCWLKLFERGASNYVYLWIFGVYWSMTMWT